MKREFSSESATMVVLIALAVMFAPMFIQPNPNEPLFGIDPLIRYAIMVIAAVVCMVGLFALGYYARDEEER